MTKKWHIVNGVVVIILLIGILSAVFQKYRAHKKDRGSIVSVTSSTTKIVDTSHPYGIFYEDITSEQWSKEIVLGVKDPKNFSSAIIGESVPLVVMINGDKELHYVEPGDTLSLPGKIVSIRFKLGKCQVEKARLSYEITR